MTRKIHSNISNILKCNTPSAKGCGGLTKKKKMYYHYKNELRKIFINLDKVDKISLDKKNNQINFTISGKPVIIYCKDKVEASRIYNVITDTLTVEKGVVACE